MRKKKIRSGWTEYFNFSARERRGAAFLSAIIIIQIIFLTWLRNHKQDIVSPDPEVVNALLATLNENAVLKKDTLITTAVLHPTSFDPNNITTETASAAGLSDKQLKVILNYISKGGVFRTKNDFSKMYCIPPAQFNKLKPFLLLPDSFVFNKTIKKESKPERSRFTVDLNKSDSTELTRLRGIGDVFASRIVKYRERLGGFYSKEQLKEVWGMKDSLYEAIAPFMTLHDTIPYRFLNLNTDSITVLASHPYIRWKLAKLIDNFRKQRPIESIEQLKTIPLVDEETAEKIFHYVIKK